MVRQLGETWMLWNEQTNVVAIESLLLLCLKMFTWIVQSNDIWNIKPYVLSAAFTMWMSILVIWSQWMEGWWCSWPPQQHSLEHLAHYSGREIQPLSLLINWYLQRLDSSHHHRVYHKPTPTNLSLNSGPYHVPSNKQLSSLLQCMGSEPCMTKTVCMMSWSCQSPLSGIKDTARCRYSRPITYWQDLLGPVWNQL
jgi:hypothetical protein